MKNLLRVLLVLSVFIPQQSHARTYKIGPGEEKCIGIGKVLVYFNFTELDENCCVVRIRQLGTNVLDFPIKIKRNGEISQDTLLGKMIISCKESQVEARITLGKEAIKESKIRETVYALPIIMQDNYPEDMTGIPIPPEAQFEEPLLQEGN